MDGIVYKWVNNLNKKWYIGSHNGKDPNYTASGVAINRAFDKHGLHNFTKHVIYEGDDFRLVEELCLISHDAENDPDSYNMKNCAIGGKTAGSFKKGREAWNKGKSCPAQSKRMKANNPNKYWKLKQK